MKIKVEKTHRIGFGESVCTLQAGHIYDLPDSKCKDLLEAKLVKKLGIFDFNKDKITPLKSEYEIEQERLAKIFSPKNQQEELRYQQELKSEDNKDDDEIKIENLSEPLSESSKDINFENKMVDILYKNKKRGRPRK